MHLHGTATGMLRRLEPLLAAVLRRRFRGHYRRLKALLEARPPAAAGGG